MPDLVCTDGAFKMSCRQVLFYRQDHYIYHTLKCMCSEDVLLPNIDKLTSAQCTFQQMSGRAWS